MEQKRMQRVKQTTAQYVQVRPDEVFEEDEYDDVWPPRMSSSARRYQGLADVRTEVGRVQVDVQPLESERPYCVTTTGGKSAVPPRRTALTQTNLPVVQVNRRPITRDDEIVERHSDQLPPVDEFRRPRVHWLFFVGMVMFIMVIGWVVLTLLASWWQVTLDDWHYGRPRTYQVDQVVGHNDSAANPSHFVAFNLNRHVQVIEFPGGDSSKAKIYIGPTLIGSGQDLAVVTLTFKDVNNDGKPDMIINIGDNHFVFINDNGQFRPTHPGENVQL
ncbi:MAG: hypothetical protein NVS4B7_14410 [Ktedonobacteraceae bacterium]